MRPELQAKVEAFLHTFRLGVDFGESAGGIALVHENRVIHAETFVDFHNTTLEQRRTLRRGRRTRHAKKMRLARLRSWILRQHLPGGEKLPDPYKIMWDARYQTKPGIYEQSGQDPRKIDGWIEAAKKGEVDPSGFVCALTQIFQKRGYKYDDKELSEFKDERLIDFLNSCCLLERATDLEEAMRAEVERRKKPKLYEAFERARMRQPEPRKAVPRQVKEDELRKIIGAFGKKYGFSELTITAWEEQLCGLLNRVLREARFDNRIKSGCTWCGKKTPRLAKVRDLAYGAALSNLRILDQATSRGRLLNPREREAFLTWWERRELAKQDKHKFRKDARAPIFERAPSKENIDKAFDELKVKKTWLRDRNGKPYLGYAMLHQLDNLLNHTPKNGRASLCTEHLQMAKDGKNMQDANVPWHTLRVRAAPNPCREQHDSRVLRRIEKIVFVRGRKGAIQAWRHGPLSFITLEVPEPSTLQVRKGQQTERQALSRRERLHRETGGLCVYQNTAACRARGGIVSSDGVEKDHIVPRERGGPDVWVNYVCVCHDCNHGNTGKGSRLPSEWFGSGSPGWTEFVARVQGLPNLPTEKKALLLLEPGSGFPEDATPLAHVGARPRAFIADLIKLFDKYEVPAPTLEYRVGSPHVQRVPGSWTQTLRMSWRWLDRGTDKPNFPEKNRADLYNHAQDAALLAATPPHTWRLQMLCERAFRICAQRDQQGSVLRDSKGVIQTEIRERPGVAFLTLAPNWNQYASNNRHPLVSVLGGRRLSRKKQFADLTFYQNPSIENELRLKKHEPSPAVGPNGERRSTVEVQKGGLVVRVPYRDPFAKTRRVRKVQVKPIKSVAALFWRNERNRLSISLKLPQPIHDFVERLIEPPIPDGAERLGEWARGATIELPATGDFLAGFYRVKELAENGIIVIPENNVTAEIAKRLGLPKEEVQVRERKVGKTELLTLLTPAKKSSATGAALRSSASAD